MINWIRQLFRPTFGARHPSWRKVVRIQLDKYPICAVCETKKGLEIHHIRPYNLFPELELEFNNLITLCRTHHFLFGHLNSWHSYNENVVEDAKMWNKKLINRP